MSSIVFIAVGIFIGFLFGLNYKSSPTPIMNFKRMENDNTELIRKVEFYKKIIKDLVDDNRKLANELDNKNE